MKGSESTHQLRVTQRLRLESSRLEEVNKRLSGAGTDGHALLLALPHTSGQEQAVAPADSNYRPIRSLVNYLKQKDAAGIVALSGTQTDDQEDNISKCIFCFIIKAVRLTGSESPSLCEYIIFYGAVKICSNSECVRLLFTYLLLIIPIGPSCRQGGRRNRR